MVLVPGCQGCLWAALPCAVQQSRDLLLPGARGCYPECTCSEGSYKASLHLLSPVGEYLQCCFSSPRSELSEVKELVRQGAWL